jgi:hypothetical protein
MDGFARAASEGAGDRFEIEISDLRETHLAGSRWSTSRSPMDPRLTGRGRALRLGSAALTVALALLVALGGFAALRDPALALLAGPASTPQTTLGHARLRVVTSDASLWVALRQRPLHLPSLDAGAPCPAMPGHLFAPAFGVGLGVGGGMVYAMAPGAAEGSLRYTAAGAFAGGGSEWGGQVVLWAVSLGYGGPVLVRGHQLDGPNELRFNGGLHDPNAIDSPALAPVLTDLRLLPVPNGDGEPWGTSLAYTRVRAPGCYAYQIDGLSFSDVVVFQALPDQ